MASSPVSSPTRRTKSFVINITTRRTGSSTPTSSPASSFISSKASTPTNTPPSTSRNTHWLDEVEEEMLKVEDDDEYSNYSDEEQDDVEDRLAFGLDMGILIHKGNKPTSSPVLGPSKTASSPRLSVVKSINKMYQKEEKFRKQSWTKFETELSEIEQKLPWNRKNSKKEILHDPLLKLKKLELDRQESLTKVLYPDLTNPVSMNYEFEVNMEDLLQ